MNQNLLALVLMVLQAYIDDSRQGDKVLVLAGYIASIESWAEFSDEWDEHLKHFGRDRFRASELRTEEFQASFYRIIERFEPTAIACSVPIRPLNRVVDELVLPDADSFKNPYYFAFKAIVNMTAQHQTKAGLLEPVDFVFDRQSEQSRVLGGWEAYVANLPDETRMLTGDPPIFRSNDEYRKFRPLEAADLYAWWVRKWWLECGTIMIDPPPFPWPLKKELVRMHYEFGEDDLRSELTKAKQLIDKATRTGYIAKVSFSSDL